jgi:Arc/MetJ-type ribon-helix-helix transcriptional regulator
MLHEFPPDIEALITAQMAAGHYQSQDDVIRAALEHLADQDEDLRAIEQSIDLVDAGDPGIPLDIAFADLRAKFDVPADA